MPWVLPPEVETVLREFRVCELTTLARDGTPTTWPTAARYEPEHTRFLITTSIGFPQKAFNPWVSNLDKMPLK